jgi:hypothetical protein
MKLLELEMIPVPTIVIGEPPPPVPTEYSEVIVSASPSGSMK